MVIIIYSLFASFSAEATSSHSVKGYAKKNGEYIAPHKQTNPDQLRRNNYSSEGNYNPNTGKPGKQRNEFSNPPKYNKSYINEQGQRLNQLQGQ
jgi:hypothetical protein